MSAHELAHQVADIQSQIKEAIRAVIIAKSKVETALTGMALVDTSQLDIAQNKLITTDTKFDESMTTLTEAWNSADDYRRGIL